MAVQRSFREISKDKVGEADQQSFLVSLGWSKAPEWGQLLESKRVLIISEAGAGKTYECRAQRQRLWEAGEPAFVLELATLANSDVRAMLDHDEEVRLDAWLASQSDVATFFLDSIDELKLSLGSFEQALKQLNKAIAGQLARTRIVITTRPVPFDEQLVRRLLPVPLQPDTEATGDTFAQIALHGRANRQQAIQDTGPADWRTVALMPLSDKQIAEFARDQGVDDPQALLEDLRRRNAQEFARRPQDLLELCADWRDFKRIRTHREQVASNNRLEDIDDLLLRDVSPREAWAGITDERVLRREIARELSRNANGLYKIDQEAVTADEKETDIRLRSTATDHEAVVELKLGDKRSASDLRDTIGDQLVKKYMAAETSRSGCLMFSISKDRKWEHPDTGTRIGLDELVSLLQDEAQKIEMSLGGSLRLHIHILDLRPRLPTEAKRVAA